MDVITAERLDYCILLSNRLLNLADEDHTQITCCLQGEQLSNYRKMIQIEQEKLAQLKTRLQTLCDAQMLLP